MEAERRFWNRGAECLILVDVKDWTDERLIFTCVVWPVLQAEDPNVFRSLDERVEEDKRERIQAVIDRQAPRVQESYQEARRLAERNVDSCWRGTIRGAGCGGPVGGPPRSWREQRSSWTSLGGRAARGRLTTSSRSPDASGRSACRALSRVAS